MARWLDPLTKEEVARLKALADSLRRIKPEGWSIVWRTNEVSIRPSNRSLGRFSVICSERHGYLLSFYSREAGIWNKRRQFACDSMVAEKIVGWMLQAAGDPKREESDYPAA
jgi:hypothetical protein